MSKIVKFYSAIVRDTKPRKMPQTELEGIAIRRLFSREYLTDRLPKSDGWQAMAPQRELFDRVREVFTRAGSLMDSANEEQIRGEVINKILDVINPHYLPGETLSTGAIPDYVFFADVSAKQRKEVRAAIGVGEAKEPGKDFERVSGERSPVRQVYDYMTDSQTRWGILTDGSRWRLLSRDAPADRFVEVDLRDTVARNDVEGWLYFYNLFRREAFVSTAGKCFLDRVKEESLEYSQAVGEELKDRVYSALRQLASGFAAWPDNGLDPSVPETRAQIRGGCFILLYRLLFVFFAEAGNLLPRSADGYRRMSLGMIRDRVMGASRDGSEFSAESRQLWIQLQDLFRLIDQGSPQIGISPYNGGLFSRRSSSLPYADFLQKYEIADRHLARAIDLLGSAPSLEDRTEFVSVDYAGLEIRHLGSIYEGLLEYQLAYAAEDLVSVKGKGGDTWIPARDYTGRLPIGRLPPDRKVKTGEVYLETERHERKSTGSYYTPDFVVRYLVSRTLGPIVDSRRDAARRDRRKQSAAVISVRVCDPAMGSGHFLVEAVQFLASALLDAVEEDQKSGLLPPDSYGFDWAKREVVQHCIYGVDLNELAVELAKVSLWLVTIAKERPLSFLDHRLKVGNSLIGTGIVDFAWLPKERPKNAVGTAEAPLGLVQKIRDRLRDLELSAEETVDDVRRKEKKFEQLRESDEYRRIKALGDIHTGMYFSSADFDTIRSGYMDLVNEAYYGNPEKWQEKSRASWGRQPIEEAAKRRFFHWELEFPEVLLDGNEGGFDAILGNPPYVRAETADKAQRQFVQRSPRFSTVVGRFDVYPLFLETGVRLTRRNGRLGMIVPRAVLTINYAEKLREWILSEKTLEDVVDFGESEVFPGVGVACCTLIIENSMATANSVVRFSTPRSPPKLDATPFAIPQMTLLEQSDRAIRPSLTNAVLPLKRKVDDRSIRLGQICYCITGVVAHDSKTGASKDRLISNNRRNEWYRPYIEAKEWDGRYSWIDPGRFIEYRPDQPGHMHRPKFRQLFDSPKIFVQGISSGSHLIATVDKQGIIANHSLNCCVKLERVMHLGDRLNLSAEDRRTLAPDPRYDLNYVQALLSSTLIGFYHRTFVSPALSVFPATLRALPIRRIEFDYSWSEPREDAVHRLFGMVDNAPRLLAEIDEFPNESRNTILHDFLAKLADHMITLNRTLQIERHGFVEWLRSELACDLETLAGKSLIKSYDQHALPVLIEVLRKNRSKIKPDPRRRDFQERVRAEHARSLARLQPTKDKIASLDSLIDNLVYRLYDLGPEDISVVERARE